MAIRTVKTKDAGKEIIYWTFGDASYQRAESKSREIGGHVVEIEKSESGERGYGIVASSKTVIERKPIIVAKCNCCGAQYTLSEFLSLATPAGDGDITDMRGVDNEEPSFYQFRNCPCESTIGIALDKNMEVYNE